MENDNINPYETDTRGALYDKLIEYLRKHHLSEIQALEPTSTFMLPLSNHDIQELFAEAPDIFTALVKDAIIELLSEYPYSVNQDITKREFAGLNIRCSMEKTLKLSEVPSTLVNSPVGFNTIITGVDERKLYVYDAYMRCPSFHTNIEGVHRVNAKREVPFILCPECKSQMIVVPEKSTYRYMQRIVIQQPLEEAKGGTQIEHDAVIVGDLVGDVSVGEKKQCVGMFRAIVNEKKLPEKNELRIIYELISAVNLDVQKELIPKPEEVEEIKEMTKQPDFFDKLADSYAPEVIGGERMRDIKKTILLLLVGGIKTPKKRGNINILLLGDPSVAKSSLLKFGTQLIPKSLYTTGKGASAAGLTIGMVKRPDGTMIAQAGVLPLCNNGVAFVDELDKMNQQDRSALHEVMEQQTASIAKSGNIIKLPAATAVLAAANPKGGRYDRDPKAKVLDNVNLTLPLLTRFDIKWLMLDIVEEKQDTKIAEAIIDEYQQKTKAPISIDMMSKIIMTAKTKQPTFNDDAKKELTAIYNKLRGFSQKDERAIIDPRQLESIIRLSTAHARLHSKDVIELSDINVAKTLLNTSLKSFGLDPESGGGDIYSKFEDSVETQDKEFWMRWTQCEDNDGYVNLDDFIKAVMKNPMNFKSEYDVKRAFDKRRKYNMFSEDVHGHYKRVNRGNVY